MAMSTTGQLMSWAPSLTHENKWDRLTFSRRGTFVIGWVMSEEDKFHAFVFNTSAEGQPIIAKRDFNSLDDAKALVDAELKKQGFQI